MFDVSRFVDFPKSSYEALAEVQSFLELNGVDLGQAFEVLLSSDDGYLIYWFGDIEIQFTRGFGVESKSGNAILMSIELANDKIKKSRAYEYVLRDLKLLKSRKQR